MSKPIPEGVLRAFDSAVLILSELTDEAAELKQKFGERSKLVERKIKQVEGLKSFYSTVQKFVEEIVQKNIDLGVSLVGAEVMLMQKLHGLSFRDAAKVLDLKFSEEFLQAQDDIDKVIKDATQPLSANDGD